MNSIRIKAHEKSDLIKVLIAKNEQIGEKLDKPYVEIKCSRLTNVEFAQSTKKSNDENKFLKMQTTKMNEEIKVLVKNDSDNVVPYEEISKYKEAVNVISGKMNLASVIDQNNKFGSREKIITILKQHHDAIIKINTMRNKYKNEDNK